MNKPVAYACQIVEADFETNIIKIEMIDKDYKVSAGIKYLSNTHPVNPTICVGYWDNKTGAFHKHLTESQQKRVDEGFLQPVYTAEMLPIRELTDEEILKFIDAFCTDMGNHWELSESNALEMIKAILLKAQEK